MPKSLLDVQDEFDSFKQQHPDDATPIHEFAKQMDTAQGTPGERGSAYIPHWYSSANALVDRGFRATGLPEVSKQTLGGLAGLIDSAVGTNVRPTVERIGEDLPRSIAESIATIPTGPVGEAAVWLPRIRKLAQAAGYAGAGLSGYAQTDSPVGAAIGAGTMYGMNKLLLPSELGGMDVGGVAADAVRKRLGVGQAIDATAGGDLASAAPELQRYNPLKANVLPGVAAAGAEAGTLGAVNEASRQAMMSVGPNAQPLSSPERNPFTPENIAGQVVNALPFAGQAAMGLRHASGFDPKAVRGAYDWTVARKQAVEADARGQTEGPVTAEEVHDEIGAVPRVEQPEFDLKGVVDAPAPKFTPTEQATLVQAIRTQLDTAKMARGEGATSDADVLYGKARAMLETASLTEGDIPAARRVTQEVDTEARQMPPKDVDGLGQFVQKVNGLIDFWNENRAKVESGENPVGPTSGPTQAYHPAARDPSVVERMQGKDLLPKITYDWLKKEYNATFDDTGNPQFASDVVAQKVANYLLDNLPEALKQETKGPVETPVSPQVQKVNSQEAQFFDALSQFSGPVQEKLISQTLKFRRAQDRYVQGRQMNPYDSWQRAVITAAQTFDPMAQTVSIYKGGKLQKSSITNLWSPDYQPVLTPVKAGAGGKGTVSLGGRTLPEGNLEAMSAPENVQPEGEESVVEQAGQAGLSGETSQGAIYRKRDSEAATPVEETLPAETMTQEQKDKFLPQAEAYRKTVESLTPEQAWSLIRGVFAKSPNLNDFRAANAKTALQAVAENVATRKGDTIGTAGQALVDAYKAAGYAVNPKWTDKRTLGVVLHSFFPSHVPADETTPMTTLSSGRRAVADRGANQLVWMQKVVQRVLDPRAVEAAKSMGGTQAMAGDVSGAGTDDLLVNHPAPGAFEQDTLRTLRDAFSKRLGERGYSGSFRDLAVEMGMAVARQAPEPSATDLYRIAQGPRGLARGEEGRGQVGLNVDSPVPELGEVKWVHDVLNTFTHELAHLDSFIAYGMLPRPDAFSEERARQIQNIKSLAEQLQPEERHLFLATLEGGLRPPQFEAIGNEKTTGLKYGSSSPEEFYAVVQSLVTQSLLFGKSNGMRHAMDVLDYSPVEVQEFAQGTYRAIRDVSEALKETIADPAYRSAVPIGDTLNRYVSSEAFDAVVNAARYASKVRDGAKEVAAARDYITSVSGPAALTMPQGATNAMWFKRVKDTSRYVAGLDNVSSQEMAGVTDSIQQMRAALGMPAELRDKDIKPNWFFDNFVPFGQVMWNMQRKGVRMAAPLADLLLTIEEAIHRRRSEILAPLMKKDAKGNVDWNRDNPFVGNVDAKVRDGFNEVSRWQRENSRTASVNGSDLNVQEPMFVLDPKLGVVPNPQHHANAVAAWAELSKRMDPQTMNAVMSGSVSADQIGQSMNAYTSSVIRERGTISVARMLMTFYPKIDASAAYQRADRVMQGFTSGDLSKAGLTPEDAQDIGAFLNGTNGTLDTMRKMDAFQQMSTGYRTEQLPHDWIIQYKNSDGKMQYASAPSPKQAGYVMTKIQRQGNELVGENPKNRADLRSAFQDFDDPSAVIERAAFLENEAWKNAVNTIRTTRGDAIADALMNAYHPMAESLNDVASQGFRKFVEGSQSKVGRENYDYLDGMLSRAGRLASSGAYHTHGAMKDLILGDPSVRDFPSFAKKVNEQWESMTSPTDSTTAKVKAVSAAYFLGANLSSILIRATHSLSTFVPVLISLDRDGGPVKAWQNVFKSVGQAAMTRGEDIESTANAALKKNSKVWTDDDKRAVALQQAYSGGVIGNNVFSEIFSQKDFRAQQTATFGTGDYGPKSAFELAGDGLYNLSQMSTALYGWVARQNDKVGFLAGVNQGLDKGLEGDALYNHARQYWQLATGGGGKENLPGVVARTSRDRAWERSAMGLAYTLQHYGATLVGLYGQLGSDSIQKSETLTPQQKRQAQKAFAVLVTTQTAAAGALGLPFVGAGLVTLQNMFGIPATQLVRQGLASLGADDDDPTAPSWTKGSTIAEVAMNGLSNQLFGLDLSSRIGASSLFGVSSYRGFDGGDLLGPTSSIIANAGKAASLYGEGKPWQATQQLVPQAFKDIMGLAASHAKYGDYSIRDAGDNLLYTPSPAQAIGYSAGFRPQEVSQRRQQADLLQFSNDRFARVQETRLNGIAESLVQGNPQPARQYAQQLREVDPTVKTDDTLRAVMERAVELTRERDLLASGPRLNRQNQTNIAETFPASSMPRQSEVAGEGLRTQLAARLGAPELMPQAQDWSRSAVVDGLVQQSGGRMPRSQALAMVRMMGL